MLENEPYCSIYLFINSSSGGGVGQKLISQEVEKVVFDISLAEDEAVGTDQNKVIYVYFYNMKVKKEKGFLNLKKDVEQGKKVIVIVCGGDGSIMWVVTELHQNQIDTDRTPIAVIPLGTGNDFSQHLGWGKEKTTLTENSYKSLKKLIKKWLVSTEHDFDIWHLEAECFYYGKFQKVNKQFQNQIIPGTTFNRSFCNYFSFGIDGKIGYSFDMHRTTSRTGNLFVYGLMGMIKNVTKTKTLNQLVETMQEKQDIQEDHIQIQQKIDQPYEHIKSQIKKQTIKMNKNVQERSQIIFKSLVKQKKQEKKQEGGKQLYLQKDYYNLLFLNINSFMGGVPDIWNNAKCSSLNENMSKFSETSSKDGKLDILSFSSGMGMAMERVFGGFGQKITQGHGPYEIKFKQYATDPKHRTYIQVDGQFIRFTNPRTIKVKKSPLAKNGKIRVLVRNPAAEANAK